MPELGFQDVRAAHARIREHIHRTPVLTCAHFDRVTGARVLFKCENFQRTGAFKLRGALNAVLGLSEDELARGVLTASSGNHGQALAYAARLRGARCWVVLPEDATPVKRAAMRGYGAELVVASRDPDERLGRAEALQQETGAVFVPPFNDPAIVAGQGTAALELVQDAGPVDVLLAPVGGGGLASGTALAAAGLTPQPRVLGAEPAAADDAARSLACGRRLPSEHPSTMADGLRSSLGELTFRILRERLAGIVTVDEPAIAQAMRTVWERMKIVIEPSAAVAVAALLSGEVARPGERVGVILSGGNVDLDRLPWADG